MQHHTEIRIASELDLQTMQRGADMTCDAVLDLRFTDAAAARPVEEEVFLRLRNLQVGYDQLPVDLDRADGRRKGDLVRRISEHRGPVMIVTDQPEAASALCRDIARAVPQHHLSEAA